MQGNIIDKKSIFLVYEKSKAEGNFIRNTRQSYMYYA